MTCMAARVQVAEPRAGPRARERGICSLAHGLVDPALHVGERAADREGARDVGRVEAVDLDARVEQDQVAGHDRAVVARPVQVARVRAGCGDRVVALRVAVAARALVEDALDDALAPRVLEDAGRSRDDVVEAVGGDVDGELQLGDLVLVLDQPQLGHEAGEVGVVVDDEIVVRRLERVDVARRDAEVGGDAREGRARPDPELADRRDSRRTRRGAVGALAEVEGHVVATVARAARRRAPSRARRRRPSRSGARTRSARGTGSRCRCCAV